MCVVGVWVIWKGDRFLGVEVVKGHPCGAFERFGLDQEPKVEDDADKNCKKQDECHLDPQGAAAGVGDDLADSH